MEGTLQRYLQEPDEFRQVVHAAMTGDKSVMPAVREILNAAPEWAQELGNLSQQTENKLINTLVGTNLFQREATKRELESHKQKLAEPSYVETLLLEQITLDWLMLQCARKRAQERLDAHSDKLLTGAHRRLLASTKCLEQIRRLAPPVRINIAENQVNMN